MSQPSSTAAAPRVLVVEDEFIIRLTLAEALADEGYDVLEAESGDDALTMLQAGPAIRLLLTDVNLPGKLDGKGLAARAREGMPGLPVIYMTGAPDPGNGSSPRDVYIAKPYALEEVCRAARRLVTAAP